MVEDFLKDVVLVLIPVATGAILAPIITHRWQTRSAKIKIKKGDREMISLIGFTLLFGTLYLIWKCWYIPKVEKFIRGEGWS